MMKSSTTRLLLLALALSLLAACGQDNGSVRYKLSLEVDVEGETKRGFSVVELSSWTPPRLTPEMGAPKSSTKGEALVLDLGRGRVLVALLQSSVRTDLANLPGWQNSWPPLHKAYGTNPSFARNDADHMKVYRSY
jgi:hypothetical protein